MSNGYEVMADPTANLSRRAVVGDFGPRELVSLSKQASPQTRYQSSGGYKIGEELGRSGLRHWGGFVFEEWLRELQQGRRAAEVYRDMMDSDAIIGSIMYLIQTLIRRVTWRVEPGDSSRAAQQGADWYWSVLNDMRWSWTDTVGEIICFLGYGYSYLEEVYKYRRGENRDPVRSSTSTDGTIGLAKLGLRAQDALWKWVFDDNGEIEGMIQNPPPDYLLRYVPMEKALLFRTTIFKNNPEGRSVLRSAYRSWYMAKNFQNIEGIGVERDLAGLPVLKPPPEIDLWNPNDPTTAPLQAMAQNMVSSIRRDEQEGIIVPYGWELELLTTEGRRQFDVGAIITRYETRMAMTTLGGHRDARPEQRRLLRAQCDEEGHARHVPRRPPRHHRVAAQLRSDPEVVAAERVHVAAAEARARHRRVDRPRHLGELPDAARAGRRADRLVERAGVVDADGGGAEAVAGPRFLAADADERDDV